MFKENFFFSGFEIERIYVFCFLFIFITYIKSYLNQKKEAKFELISLKNQTAEKLDNLHPTKLNIIPNRFSNIFDKLKIIFSNTFGISEEDEIEKYNNERL